MKNVWILNSKYTRKIIRLMLAWDGQCSICGEGFTNLACITLDHVIPRSKGGIGLHGNLAPAHHRCNQEKGNDSLFVAAAIIEDERSRVPEKQFYAWLNRKVPGRITPPEALEPIQYPVSMQQFEKYFLPAMQTDTST